MAQGVAWAAREVGVRCRVIAPDNAPRAKLDRVEELGGELILLPHEEWWRTIIDGAPRGHRRPVRPSRRRRSRYGRQRDDRPRARRDAPDFNTVVIPWGGGGLTSRHRERAQALHPEVRARDRPSRRRRTTRRVTRPTRARNEIEYTRRPGSPALAAALPLPGDVEARPPSSSISCRGLAPGDGADAGRLLATPATSSLKEPARSRSQAALSARRPLRPAS